MWCGAVHARAAIRGAVVLSADGNPSTRLVGTRLHNGAGDAVKQTREKRPKDSKGADGVNRSYVGALKGKTCWFGARPSMACPVRSCRQV